MTTKDALELAISVLQENPQKAEYLEAIKLLQRLQKRDIVAQWSQETIIAALDNWKDQHGKPPTVTNLIEPGMPGANIIQKHFGVRASALLYRRYPPDNNPAPPKNRYGYITTEDWLACFREQFLKHCTEEGFCSKTYNMLKDKDTPLWMTIARHCGTTQWSKLMKLADVKYPGQVDQYEPGTLHVSSVKSPWLERLEAAVAKREELDQQLIDTMEKNNQRKKKQK